MRIAEFNPQTLQFTVTADSNAGVMSAMDVFNSIQSELDDLLYYAGLQDPNHEWELVPRIDNERWTFRLK